MIVVSSFGLLAFGALGGCAADTTDEDAREGAQAVSSRGQCPASVHGRKGEELWLHGGEEYTMSIRVTDTHGMLDRPRVGVSPLHWPSGLHGGIASDLPPISVEATFECANGTSAAKCISGRPNRAGDGCVNERGWDILMDVNCAGPNGSELLDFRGDDSGKVTIVVKNPFPECRSFVLQTAIDADFGPLPSRTR